MSGSGHFFYNTEDHHRCYLEICLFSLFSNLPPSPPHDTASLIQMHKIYKLLGLWFDVMRSISTSITIQLDLESKH